MEGCKVLKMFLIAFILGVSLIPARAADVVVHKCPDQFRCAPNGLKMEKGICIKINRTLDNIVYHDINLSQCSSSEECKLDFFNDSKCVPKLPKGPYYPGMVCTTNTDCHSNLCENKFCVGVKENQPCTKSEQCGVSLFCDLKGTKKCLKQKLVGEVCSSYWDCVNSAGCDKGKCVGLYSLPDGTKASSIYCKSGDAIDGHCATLTLQSPAMCTESQENCEYKQQDKDTIVKKKCKCSVSSLNTRYCGISSSSDAYRSTISKFKNFYSFEATKYHSMDRFNHFPQDLNNASMETIEYPRIVGADSCALKAYTKSSNVVISLALLFASALLIVFT